MRAARGARPRKVRVAHASNWARRAAGSGRAAVPGAAAGSAPA